ncbi:MAG: hypothetical protein ACI86S_001027 [Paracoccaceae bacterium]|jgi:hypothetical protein
MHPSFDQTTDKKRFDTGPSPPLLAKIRGLMAAQDLFTKPNVAWGAALSVTLAVLPQYNAPIWISLPVYFWLFFWFCALVELDDAKGRTRLDRLLSHQDFKSFYHRRVIRPFARIWRRYCDPARKTASAAAVFRAALTWRLYDVALLFAVVYPVFLCLGFWLVLGWDGLLGSVVIFPSPGPWWDIWPERAGMIGVLSILTAGFIGRKLAAASQRVFLRKAADWLASLALAFAVGVAGMGGVTGAIAGTIAVIVTGAFAFPLLGAGAVAIALAIAVGVAGMGGVTGAVLIAIADALAIVDADTDALAATFTIAGAVAIALAIAGAIALAIAVESLDARSRPRLARWLVTLAVPVGWVTLVTVVDWTDISQDRRAIFLFLGVFPLINALFDTVSYAATLALMRLGLRRWNPLVCALIDVAVACVLFLCLGVTLTAVIATLNRLAGVDLIDIGAFFALVQESPRDHLWVMLMLFSTILPTAIHFVLALFGAQLFVPGVLRGWTVTALRNAPTSGRAAVAAPLLAGLCAIVPFLIVGGLGAVIWHYGEAGRDWAVGHYFDGLLYIATHIIGAF